MSNLKKTGNVDVVSSSDWTLDPVELASVFNERTKIILMNNPNNPLGKVYTG